MQLIWVIYTIKYKINKVIWKLKDIIVISNFKLLKSNFIYMNTFKFQFYMILSIFFIF